MNIARTLAATCACLALAGLAACSSSSEPETDGAPGDHSTHEHGSGDSGAMHAPATGREGEPHAGHGDHVAEAVPGLKKIEPSADYPLSTCVVSGDDLAAMGEPSAYEYEGQEVQFCCDGCVDEFKESPAKFVAKVKEAAKK